ncbi:hypothetical protein GOP47_0030623 [Adiantum capillus-veneris]|nr:hypothetical protein GOP47_0030623 [Adiantum capillus-veneris]
MAALKASDKEVHGLALVAMLAVALLLLPSSPALVQAQEECHPNSPQLPVCVNATCDATCEATLELHGDCHTTTFCCCHDVHA